MPNEYFMQRCLRLAALGIGKVAPNPMVGCVIVHNGLIIGEGYHRQYGEAHAEVNAINSLADPSLLIESTVYISLEPCSHFGKTPPCVDLLLKHKVKKVVIGCLDPDKRVAGKGIEILRSANIEVETFILESECKELNKRFFTFHEKHRPYIILKWAETKDGFIAGGQKQISGVIAQTILHQWRTEEAAFMVGVNTLVEDNPQLNVRKLKGNNPLRIAVDPELRSLIVHEKHPLHLYDQSQKTIILNRVKNEVKGQIEFVKLDDTSPYAMMHALHDKQLLSVVIEGGQVLLKSFIAERLFDEIRVFKSKEMEFKEGLAAPVFMANVLSIHDLETDILTIYKP